MSTLPAVIYAGDPGASGAVARFVTRPKFGKPVMQLVPLGDIEAHRALLRQAQFDVDLYGAPNIYVGLERQGLRPGDQKKAHAVSLLLLSTGALKLCFDLSGVPVEFIAPQTWQFPYGLVGHKYEVRKAKAWEIAKTMHAAGAYPLAQDKILKPSADAYLILDYLCHKLGGTPYPEQEKRVNKRLTIVKTVSR